MFISLHLVACCVKEIVFLSKPTSDYNHAAIIIVMTLALTATQPDAAMSWVMLHQLCRPPDGLYWRIVCANNNTLLMQSHCDVMT